MISFLARFAHYALSFHDSEAAALAAGIHYEPLPNAGMYADMLRDLLELPEIQALFNGVDIPFPG